MRFASHRDVARAIERGVRMAGVPVGFSAGFSPHPKISYPGGAPTGAASEAEFLEISLTRACEPADVGRRLDSALPDGIDVIEVVEVAGKSVATGLDASRWEVVLPGVDPEAAAAAVGSFLAEPSVVVERLTSKGVRQLDTREAVLDIEVGRRARMDRDGADAILRMNVRHLTPAVRPDDVVAALRKSSMLTPESPALVTRLWQGPLADLPVAADRPATADAAFADAEPGRLVSLGGVDPRPTGEAAGQETDKASWLPVGSALAAPAGQAHAVEQLSRTARGQLADPGAREPDGRDCPNARHRASGREVQYE